MFLEEFVPDKVKWCHIDIAGPAFTKTGFNYNPKGGTGVGVRTLLYYLDQHKL
jgi:Leucyl aminopeptidase